MATHTYQVNFANQEQEPESKEVKAEDFRVVGSAVVFYRHIMGDKANTHLFNADDISSIEIKESGE